MPQKIKIFISHSAHKPYDIKKMRKLIGLLEKAEFHVIWDKDLLMVGDLWRNELYSAIGCCHAAVVLVTEEALLVEKHPWVFQECSMLTILKWGDKEFPIFPISMLGVTQEQIRDSPFEALKFGEIQIGSHENLNSIVSTIKEKLKSKALSFEDEPLYLHHDRIASLFTPVDAKLLKKAIENANSKLDLWDPIDKELQFRLARILLTLDPDKVKEVLLDILPSFDQNIIVKLMNYLAPFWLDLPPIAHLDHMVQTDQKRLQGNNTEESPNYPVLRKAFGLNAKVPMTASWYANRAGFMRKSGYHFIFIPVDAGTDDVSRYAKHIKAEMSNNSALRFISMPDEEKHKIILDLAIKNPTFIIIPLEVEEEVIEMLRKLFWPFIFIVLTGQEGLTEPNLSQFEVLQPPLQKGIEDKVLFQAINMTY